MKGYFETLGVTPSKVRKKDYVIKVFRINEPAYIINKFEQRDAYQLVGEFLPYSNADKYMRQALDSLGAPLVTDLSLCILEGTVGELWPIHPDKLKSRYTLVNGEEIDTSKIGSTFIKIKPKQSGDNVLWAAKVDKAGELVTRDDYKMVFDAEDYLLSESQEGQDCWVVNGEIFNNTYQLENTSEGNLGVEELLELIPKASLKEFKHYDELVEFLKERVK